MKVIRLMNDMLSRYKLKQASHVVTAATCNVGNFCEILYINYEYMLGIIKIIFMQILTH
jgi:hypothetical protein